MSETDNLLGRVSGYGMLGALLAHNPPLRPVGSYKGSTSGTFSSTNAVNNGTNVTTFTATDFTKFEMYGFGMAASSIIGWKDDEHSMLINQLRGELFGSFSILGGITNTTINLPAQGSHYSSWWSALSDTLNSSDEWSRQVFFKFGGLDYFPAYNRKDSAIDPVLRILSKLILGATSLVIRSTEAREQYQVTAVASILVLIFLAVEAVASAIHSIFVHIIATRIIIRTLMAHRNSREPAYLPIFCLPLYQWPAGIARAH